MTIGSDWLEQVSKGKFSTAVLGLDWLEQASKGRFSTEWVVIPKPAAVAAIGLDWLEQASKGKFSTAVLGLDWLEQVSKGRFTTKWVAPEPAATVVSGFYGRMQKTANRLLIGKGQVVTLIHVIPGDYIPGEGITNIFSIQTGTGAIIDWDARQVDGTLILIGDKRLLLSPLNTVGMVLTAPVLGDTVTDAAGVVYMLVAPLKTVSPAGMAVLYDCNLRV